jgi:2-desacetyl-2-hydroxyethyl bacteriochlorophyllide A dehydrogenase
MRAAVFEGSEQGLSLREVPRPAPVPGCAIVRVAACGICHTDLHFVDEGVATAKPPPLILGHEAAGTIEEVGEGVRQDRIGERVLVPSIYGCGRCRYCRAGRENLCASLSFFGSSLDGAFAEYVAVPAHVLVPVPPSLPLEDVAIVADAVSTAFHAVRNRARVRSGDSVAVFGCGGVGMSAIQCAAAAGARVLAVDLDESKLALARELGATEIVDASTEPRPAKEIRRLTDGGADVAIEAIGKPATIRAACDSVRRGGRVCLVGYCPEEVALPVSRLTFHEIEVVGSLGCPTKEYLPLLGLITAGRIRIRPLVTAQVPLERIEEGFEKLRRGEGLRTVVVP